MDTFCANAARGNKQSARALMMSFIHSSYRVATILPYAQTLQRLCASLLRCSLDPGIKARAVAVHSNEHGAESVDAELPQRLGVEVIEVDVLDRLDPGGLQRRRAADDGQIGPADLGKTLQGILAQPTLADDQPDRVLLHQGPREPLHPVAGGGADANSLIAGWRLPHVGRGLDHRMPGHVEARAPPP